MLRRSASGRRLHSVERCVVRRGELELEFAFAVEDRFWGVHRQRDEAAGLERGALFQADGQLELA